MAITKEEAKALLEEQLEKYKKSVEKEENYKKELADDQATLEYVTAKQEKGEGLPEDCGYDSYDTWIKQLEKEIKSAKGSLSRVNLERAEIIAIEYYLANANDE